VDTLKFPECKLADGKSVKGQYRVPWSEEEMVDPDPLSDCVLSGAQGSGCWALFRDRQDETKLCPLHCSLDNGPAGISCV
jgi:hypothetical protein